MFLSVFKICVEHKRIPRHCRDVVLYRFISSSAAALNAHVCLRLTPSAMRRTEKNRLLRTYLEAEIYFLQIHGTNTTILKTDAALTRYIYTKSM